MILIISTCSLRIRLWKARFLLFADTKMGEKTCLTLPGLTRDARRCGFRAELFGLGERARSCDSSFHRGTCVVEKPSQEHMWLQPRTVRRCSRSCKMALATPSHSSKPECLRYDDIIDGSHDFSGKSLPGSSSSGMGRHKSQRNAKNSQKQARRCKDPLSEARPPKPVHREGEEG